MAGPFGIPVGQDLIVADPFGNVLVLADLSKGKYVTEYTGQVTGTQPRNLAMICDNIPARRRTFCCARRHRIPGYAQQASVALPTVRSRRSAVIAQGIAGQAHIMIRLHIEPYVR